MAIGGEVSIEQNDQVKTISAWAAILFAPSIVGTVYGMNFNHMLELHWHARLSLRARAHGRGVPGAVGFRELRRRAALAGDSYSVLDEDAPVWEGGTPRLHNCYP